MRVFKNTRFDRFAAKEDISDDELKSIVDQLTMTDEQLDEAVKDGEFVEI